ncbi:MAG: sulfite exporter TauE/SafE family protein [Nitrospira sp. LK70]|nr:sulfite exporter TauE/SafE family protein [Nitrospira sp. LK70]
MSILGDEQTGLALLSGAIVGLSLGLTGAGGSLLAIPLLFYVLNLDLHEATAISLILVGLSAALSLVGYFLTGDVKVRTALVFSPTGAVGAWFGAQGQQLVRSEVILVLFSLLMMVMAIHMWRHSRSESAEGRGTLDCADTFPPSCFLKVGSIGLIVGLLSGFFGVGGGFVIVPALSLILAFPMRASVGTSLLIIAFTSIGGIAGHLQFGGIHGGLLATLVLGSAMGIGLGATVGRWISAEITAKVFAALTIGIAVILMFDNVPKVFAMLP